MGFRFQRRIRIAPGIRLNFSSRGVSTTIGPRGASINIGPTGTHANLGIPGTGLSYRNRLGVPSPQPSSPSAAPKPSNDASQGPGFLGHEILASSDDVSSATLNDLAAELRATKLNRQRLVAEQLQLDRSLRKTARRIALLRTLTLGGRIFRGALEGMESKRVLLDTQRRGLLEEIESEKLTLDTELSEAVRTSFESLRSAFREAGKSVRVWDITSQAFFDRQVTRSVASTSVARQPTFLIETAIEEIPVSGGLLCFRNRNGADLYFSPAFLAMHKRDSDVALLDFAHLKVDYTPVQFVESEAVPNDAKVVGAAWEKSNKDGSPDRRFAQNRQMPIAVYGQLQFTSATGLKECFLFSNESAAHVLADALNVYIAVASGTPDA